MPFIPCLWLLQGHAQACQCRLWHGVCLSSYDVGRTCIVHVSFFQMVHRFLADQHQPWLLMQHVRVAERVHALTRALAMVIERGSLPKRAYQCGVLVGSQM